jgi:hypothetical protein
MALAKLQPTTTEGVMRRKVHSDSPKSVALTQRYKEIGISAVAAAARYQSNGTRKKPAAAEKKRKSADTFRGTSPRR